MMYRQLLSLTALAALVAAQETMNLTAALTSTPELSMLAQAVSGVPELLTALGNAQNITVLAPSNDALGKVLNTSSSSSSSGTPDLTAPGVLQAVLQYHVLNGTYPASAITDMPAFAPTLLTNSSYTNVTGGQVVEAVKQGDNVVFYTGLLSNATVTKADTNFTGGVIHIIDNLLVLPKNISTTAVAAGLSGVAGALTKANLVDAVDTAKDLTVFAPNNEAFQAIGSALGNLTTQDLASILQYHVVNGTVGYSSTLENGTSLTAMDGTNLTITVADGNVFVNSAKVVTPNVLVANGVVHVIDNVLNPNATTATPDTAASTQTPAFAGASSASDLPLTSGIPTPSSSIGAGPTPASASESAASTTAMPGAAAPMRTGAVGAAALFAGAGMVWNM